MRCRDTRWDRRIDVKKAEKPEIIENKQKENAVNKELQEKLKAMEEERKKQDQMWIKN